MSDTPTRIAPVAGPPMLSGPSPTRRPDAEQRRPERPPPVRRVVIVGPPGSGKGTQSELLARMLGLRHLCAGDVLRETAARATPLGNVIRRHLELGALVPDRLIFEVLRGGLHELITADRGFILDGFPRTIAQSVMLESILEPGDIDAVIHLEVPAHLASERILRRGRSDDTHATLDRRLQGFRSRTRPMIDRLMLQEEMITVDGTRSIVEIHADIVRRLHELARRKTPPRGER